MSEHGFGIDHLPYGVFGDERRVGVRFGDGVLDLGGIDTGVDPATWRGSLNPFLALGREAWSGVRAAARDAIEAGAELVPLDEVDAAPRPSTRPTTWTSTRRSSTPRTSAGCSAPTATR